MNKKLLILLVFCVFYSNTPLCAQALNPAKSSYDILPYLVTVLLVAALVVIVFLVNKNIKMTVMNHQLQVQNQKRLEQYSKADQQKEALADINKAQEDVMSSVAHDLKAPLNRVHGLVDVIFINDENLLPEQRKYLGMIKQIAIEAGTMIQNWLDVKAIENQKIQIRYAEVNIQEFIQNLLVGYQDAADKKGIDLQVSIHLKQHTFWTDSNLLNRILDNLLSNAIKFSPLNGIIKFEVREDAPHIAFSVEDQGVGISESEKGKLFEKFQKLSARPTAGESSTGLGLSIVKTLVLNLQGEIKVDSIVGQGSTFTVLLPKNHHLRSSQVTDNGIETGVWG